MSDAKILFMGALWTDEMQRAATENPCTNAAWVEREILDLLRYFSLFRHPLTEAELYRLLPDGISETATRYALRKMEITGTLHHVEDFYLLPADDTQIIQKRLIGEAMAAHLLPKAIQAGRFIGKFPFVKFVGISGSLSKHYADDHTDFDFFIITANNTLWICRTLLHLVKKLSFLVGRQHWLCMNYFVDEHHLCLEEQNIYTRIELSTLIPVHNESVYKTFLLRNQRNLTNIQHLAVDFEGALAYSPAGKDKLHLHWKPLNLLLMRLTDWKWRRKWKRKGYPMEDYDTAFKTTPYVSKNHPKNYQKKILAQLQHS